MRVYIVNNKDIRETLFGIVIEYLLSILNTFQNAMLQIHRSFPNLVITYWQVAHYLVHFYCQTPSIPTRHPPTSFKIALIFGSSNLQETFQKQGNVRNGRCNWFQCWRCLHYRDFLKKTIPYLKLGSYVRLLLFAKFSDKKCVRKSILVWTASKWLSGLISWILWPIACECSILFSENVDTPQVF